MTILPRLPDAILHIQIYVLQVFSVLAVLRMAQWIYARITRRSISKLDGPQKSDWFFGNLPDIHFNEVGISHFSWQERYGSIFKIYGILGEEYLTISDPKAAQHVSSNIDTYVRQVQSTVALGTMTGPGILVAHGDDHRRQRRLLQPAFGISHLKALFPKFALHSQKLIEVLKRDIEASGNQIAKLNMHEYMTRVTLDIVGDAIFDYQFDSLNKKRDVFTDLIHRVQEAGALLDTKHALFTQYMTDYIPPWVMRWMIYLPIKRFMQLRASRNTMTGISDKLIEEKVHLYQRGLEGGKDLMSLIVRANAAEEKKRKLSDVEVTAEIATFTLAGHATTTNTITFGLWELAKNMDMQRRLRREILEMKTQASNQGVTKIELKTFEDMPLLTAFVKEVLRFHPILPLLNRIATRDTVVPLSKPITLTTGEVLSELPISRGQKIWVNISGYNRSPELFGEDAQEFNIDRWLETKDDMKKSQGVGVYANLMTFSSGPRACIGWRFSVWETQVLLVDLLSNFEFTLPEDGTVVERISAGAMIPRIKGEKERRLCLNVSVLQD